ncbi:S24 family peptidase [Sphingomonas sp. HF-S3]|uniref:S24 family peptidase n=1 Tax=Sphingomonas rustica TaxID=3103142 RepID=A0ABV0BB64_9SPHN
MDPVEQRAALSAAIERSEHSCALLSRVIGRNPAYLQQYLSRGSPRELSVGDRARIARFLGVPEARFGVVPDRQIIEVTRMDLGASAGPGRLAEEDRRGQAGLVDPLLLRKLGVRADAASLIRVRGDSMEGTLFEGDEILVDSDRRVPSGRHSLFVIRYDGALMVKRLLPLGSEIEVISDNPDYRSWTAPVGEIDVVGRVVWLGRNLI